MQSIRRFLLIRLLGALLLGGVLASAVTYWATIDEMDEVFDAYLENAATSIGRFHSFSFDPAAPRHPPTLPQRDDTPRDVEILTVTWTPQGALVYTSDPRVQLPFIGKEGLSRLAIDGEEWIIYSNITTGGVSQAAQRVSQRQVMAGESAAQIFPPVLILFVVAGGLLVFSLRRGLRPLDTTARDVAARSVASLDAIPVESVPAEIKPLVGSINDLLSRLGRSFTLQRRFLADAAHELRTPVTALRLQLQLLRRAPDDAAREQAFRELESGIDRSQHLIQQLLAVARSEPDGEAARWERVDADELVRSVVSTFNAGAEHRGVDLGARVGKNVSLDGNPEQLRVLLSNLVDNAIRYTPAGGTVDVEACRDDGRPCLRVIDTGLGIAAGERERVFDRFYRGESAQHPESQSGGSGLGLAIVRTVAQRHRAEITLNARDDRAPGLDVKVVFPKG